MIEKLKQLYRLFHAGESVANPVAWKTGQGLASLVTAFLAACVGTAKAFGYDIQITDEQLITVGGGVVALVGMLNVIATVVSSDKVGLKSDAAPVPSAVVPPVSAANLREALDALERDRGR